MVRLFLHWRRTQQEMHTWHALVITVCLPFIIIIILPVIIVIISCTAGYEKETEVAQLTLTPTE